MKIVVNVKRIPRSREERFTLNVNVSNSEGAPAAFPENGVVNASVLEKLVAMYLGEAIEHKCNFELTLD